MSFDWQTGVGMAGSFLSDWLTKRAIIYEAEFPDKPEHRVELYYYEEITDNVSADYAETDVRGRSQPYVHYVKTNLNKITFAAKLVAGADQFSFLHTADQIVKDAQLIKSWVYPEYKGEAVLDPPPLLKMIVGNLYRGKTGIIRSAEFVHHRPWTINHLPLVIDVNIEFEFIYDFPQSRSDIRTDVPEGWLSKALGALKGKAGEIAGRLPRGDILGDARTGKQISPKSKNPGGMII